MVKRARSKKRLNKMHIWVHRRFHNALEQQLASGKYARYWLDVRSRILGIIVQRRKLSQRSEAER
ncbi:hypothetical protein ES703_86751 [subsurface metagenome]